MFVPKSVTISTIPKLYRRSFLLKSLFLVFFLCDLVLFLFSPVFVFILGFGIHIGIYIAFMNSRCNFVSALLEEQSAQKDCAPAPEVLK